MDLDGYLVKPVSQSDLLDAILSALKLPGAAEAADAATPNVVTGRPLRILLAEDTPANQKVVKAILARRGHRIDVASDGREAIDRHLRDDYDLILMDVQMPGIDGLQATAAIRASRDPAKAGIPIVAMTAHAMRGDRERCLEAGMDGYLSKPIDAADLISHVESHAARRPVRKPEFVTVVVSRPICCAAIPAKRRTPIKAKFHQSEAGSRRPARRPSTIAAGSMESVATRNRRAMKSIGPMASMALDCATNPMPHMAPASRRTRFARPRVMKWPL